MADDPDFVAMTIEVVKNYVAHNIIAPDDVPAFIAKTHTAIKQLDAPDAAETPPEEISPAFVPAVTVRKSIASREHILSLIDGKPYKTLKRHLSGHGLTPAQYRERYNLKADYPMVAPAYSDHRREVAKRLGLGRKVTGSRPSSPVEEPAPVVPAVGAEPPVSAKPGRKVAGAKPVPTPTSAKVKASTSSITTMVQGNPAWKPHAIEAYDLSKRFPDAEETYWGDPFAPSMRGVAMLSRKPSSQAPTLEIEYHAVMVQ